MEVKKSPQADLEGKKTTNLLIGAIMILAVLFVGFEWSERDKKVMTDSGIQEVMFKKKLFQSQNRNNRNRLLLLHRLLLQKKCWKSSKTTLR